MAASRFHRWKISLLFLCLVVTRLHGAVETYDETPQIDCLQFRPHEGDFADPIPFYWKGRYHVFYLQGGVGRVPWQHLVSDNLVDWKQLPTALRPDGAPDSWDGGNMFTGSVIQSGGRFYLFYTGDNGNNPLGNEGVRLAVSDNLIAWKKQPGFLLVPDGTIYATKRTPTDPKIVRDFRDPYPYKIPGRKEWWMILCANDAAHAPGVFTSTDLRHWRPAPPLDAAMQECPDLFKSGDTYYLLGADHYSTSHDLRGKFVRPVDGFIDRPGIYAGKRMFDGQRQIWVGWIADTNDHHDGPKLTWGGTMCTPRELVPGPGGILYVRPVREAIAAYSKKVLDLPDVAASFPPGAWSPAGAGFASQSPTARAFIALPDEGMVTLKLKLSPDAQLTISFHATEDGTQEGYAYTLDPAADTIHAHGQKIDWLRQGCHVDLSRPITVRAILHGDSIEFFLDDKYAFTRRAYDLRGGKLGLLLTQGSVTVQQLSFRQLSPAATAQ